MLTGKTQPLEIAKKVLDPETIRSVNKAPYNRFGWAILDRWAFNSPDLLKNLEKEGEVVLLGRLLEQQETEQSALSTTAALEQQAAGTMPHEILQALEINTEL
ncbi:hypothetical protein [Trinickia mobilis]|uniref:hypothetical protein n=1 Tax=Trinickia mobilis TaxID=2816356 RepID=UPI001F5DBE09|nr:hypothetical protein [Trinickia mobilis]